VFAWLWVPGQDEPDDVLSGLLDGLTQALRCQTDQLTFINGEQTVLLSQVVRLALRGRVDMLPGLADGVLTLAVKVAKQGGKQGGKRGGKGEAARSTATPS
jgi:hypothetical protein